MVEIWFSRDSFGSKDKTKGKGRGERRNGIRQRIQYLLARFKVDHYLRFEHVLFNDLSLLLFPTF